MNRLSTAFVACVASFAALVSGPAAADTPDMIAPQDNLSLKVLEWLPAKGEYKEWGAVGGTYTVSANRTIVVPFVGAVPVDGQSTDKLAVTIADALQRALSLPTRLEVSIEVQARAPVYILGGVETPGKVEFTPGLTALQAVALAGGFYRGGSASMRLERDTINAESDLQVARDAYARLTARIARLSTELADSEKIAIDAKDSLPGIGPLVAEEQSILNERRQSRLSQLESLSSREQLAVDQLKALDEQNSNLDHQLSLTRTQLDNIKSLAEKGLTVAGRVYDLERTLSDLEGRRLDLQIGRLTTTLTINEAQRDQLDLKTEFRTSVASELQAARSERSQKEVEMGRYKALLRESTVIAPEKLMDRAGNVSIDVRMFLTRSGASGSSTIEITRDEALQSGDTIQVQLKPEDTQ